MTNENFQGMVGYIPHFSEYNLHPVSATQLQPASRELTVLGGPREPGAAAIRPTALNALFLSRIPLRYAAGVVIAWEWVKWTPISVG